MSFLFDLLSTDKAKFKRDIKQLTQLLQSDKKDWIPIEDDEIDSIAMKLKTGKRKRVGMTSYQSGDIQTIFHELVGSYGYRKYGDKRGIIAVQTNPYLYTFLIRPKYTEVQINYKRLAYILSNGTLKNSSGRKIIGEIDWADIDHPEVLIGDNNFGILNKSTRRMNEQTRAVQMMQAMPEGVQELFVSVLLLYMITNQTDLKAFIEVKAS